MQVGRYKIRKARGFYNAIWQKNALSTAMVSGAFFCLGLALDIQTHPGFEFHCIVVIKNGNLLQKPSYKCLIKLSKFCLWILCDEVV